MNNNKTMNKNLLTDFFENVDNIVEEDILKLKQCLDKVPKQRNQITTLLVETSSLINPENFQILMSLAQDIATYLGENENTLADGQGNDHHTRHNLSLNTSGNDSA